VAKFWRARQKFGYKGYNSFVANLPNEQYHMDMAYMQPMMKDIMEEKDPENLDKLKGMEWKYCFICIDVFSKRVFTKAQKSLKQEETRKSIVEAFNEMGVPKQVYTDQGAEFYGHDALYKETRVEHITTRTHAVFAERFIRFLKTQLDVKIDKAEDAARWFVWLGPLTKYYNSNPQGTTKVSPNEAMNDKNAMEVKANIVLQSKHMRKYPPLKVGDMVKVYQKLEHEQRVYKSRWIGPYEVEKIKMKDNLT
jgi:hypothetical protein